MPVLTRLIPSPLVVDIRAGALDHLGAVLADQRIAASGRIAVAVSGGSGAAMRERLAPQLPGAAWFTVADGTLDAAVTLADQVRGGHYDALVGLGGGLSRCGLLASPGDRASGGRTRRCTRDQAGRDE